MADTILGALRAELTGYEATGDTERARQVQDQIDALTGAASERAAEPAAAVKATRGRQTRKGD